MKRRRSGYDHKRHVHGGSVRQSRSNRNKNRKSKIKTQTIICILLLLSVIAIKKMDSTIFDSAVETVSGLLHRDHTVSEVWSTAVDKAGEIAKLPSEIKEKVVDSLTQESMTPPVDLDSVLASYGEEAVFSSDSVIQTYAVAGGTVASVEKPIEDENVYTVSIQHENGLMSVYSGLTEIYANKFDNITKGTLIGTVSAENGVSFLEFELYKDDVKTDPKKYIDF